MKLKSIFTLLVLAHIQFIYPQATSILQNFDLNREVSFNDVIHFLKDRNKVLTEPSVYKTGEDILFYDENQSLVKLSYFKNSQILKSISIDYILKIDDISNVYDYIIRFKGKPSKGVVKKSHYDIKENKYMKDLTKYSYHIEYQYYDYSIIYRIVPTIEFYQYIEKEISTVPTRAGFQYLKELYELFQQPCGEAFINFTLFAEVYQESDGRTSFITDSDYVIEQKVVELDWVIITNEIIEKWE